MKDVIVVVIGDEMADQGRWFKLWCSAPGDPDLDNLNISDFGRWAKFGAYLKEHGDGGKITLTEPCRELVSKFQVSFFSAVIECIKKFPNCNVTPVTNTTVTYQIEWLNWQKYQGDFSNYRVQRFREKQREGVTPKKRGEEKRGEEKRKRKESIGDFIASLKINPAYSKIDIETELAKMDAWLLLPKAKGRKKTQQFILNWLNKIDVPSNGSNVNDEPWTPENDPWIRHRAEKEAKENEQHRISKSHTPA